MRLARLVRNVEIEGEDTLVHAAQHGERAMRRHVLDALAELEIVRELRAFLVLALAHGGCQVALGPQPFAQAADQRGRLGDALDEDVAGAFQRGFGVGDAFAGIDELRGFGFRVERRVLEQRLAQRLEPRLARDLRLGPPLRLERGVKILQLDLGRRTVDGAGELGRELAEAVDRLQDQRAAILQLPQVAEPLLELAQLRVIEAARLLLAVAGDEGDRRALTQAAPRPPPPGPGQRRAPPRCAG